MATYYLRSSSALNFDNGAEVVTLGQRVTASYYGNQTVAKRYTFEVTVAGTLSSTEPTWPTTPGTTVTCGTATLTCRECDSWANASSFLHHIAGRMAAGDTLYVSNNHAESLSSTASTSTFPSGPTNPVNVLCVDDSVDPPVSLAKTAQLTNIGSGFTINGAANIYGLVFKPQSIGTVVFSGVLNLESCSIQSTASTNANVTLGGFSSKSVKLTDFWFSFSASSAQINFNGGAVEIEGGGYLAGSASNSSGLFVGASSPNVKIRDFDFSQLSSSVNLFPAGSITVAYGEIDLINCKLPSGWSGVLASGSFAGPGLRIRMHNTDSTNTNYREMCQEYFGSIRNETVVVMNSGASNGTTALSEAMISSANAAYPAGVLALDWVTVWNTDGTGSTKTFSMEILVDSAVDLKNDEVWLELIAPGESTSTLGTRISGRKASILSSGIAQPTSAATWTTTGLTNPRVHKLSVSYASKKAGPVQARVVLAKPSTTVYVNPQLTIA